MRKVQVFKWEQQRDVGGNLQNVKVPDYMGLFHRLAQDHDDDDAPMPTAIVEGADGKLHSVYVEMVQFLPEEQKKSIFALGQPPASVIDAAPALLNELEKADRIIKVMLNTMTPAQQNAAGATLEFEGVSPDGVTRAHERRAVLAAAGAA